MQCRNRMKAKKKHKIKKRFLNEKDWVWEERRDRTIRLNFFLVFQMIILFLGFLFPPFREDKTEKNAPFFLWCCSRFRSRLCCVSSRCWEEDLSSLPSAQRLSFGNNTVRPLRRIQLLIDCADWKVHGSIPVHQLPVKVYLLFEIISLRASLLATAAARPIASAQVNNLVLYQFIPKHKWDSSKRDDKSPLAQCVRWQIGF